MRVSVRVLAALFSLWLNLPAVAAEEEAVRSGSIIETPVVFELRDAARHQVDELRIRTPEYGTDALEDDRVEFTLTVAPDGRVVSAIPGEGAQSYIDQATAVALAAIYEPFLVDGVPVYAQVPAIVFLWPLELRPQERVVFPELEDRSSLRITLVRDFGCYVGCPQYSVQISGDGTVRYQSVDNVVIYGQHTDRISEEDVNHLVSQFRDADFFWANEQYETDFLLLDSGGTICLRIAFDGVEKTIVYDRFMQSGIPESISDLAGSIDDVAGTEKRVDGNAETLASLQREGWDLSAATDDNRNSLIAALREGRDELAMEMIAAGAPIDGSLRTYGLVAVGAFEAAGGNEEMIAALTDAALAQGDIILGSTLWQVSGVGRTDIARQLIAAGADSNSANEYGQTALMRAAEMLKPEMISTLLQARADVSVRDASWWNALHWAVRAWSVEQDDTNVLEMISLLVDAGIDVNGMSELGENPMDFTEWQDGAEIHAVREALSAAGAVWGAGSP